MERLPSAGSVASGQSGLGGRSRRASRRRRPTVSPSSRPSESAAAVEETDISVVLMIGKRAFKFRKRLAPAGDFPPPEVVYADCEHEVELNRRLAPDVYLGVADVVMDGETIDHVVVTRRMPETASLLAKIQRQEDVTDTIRAIARQLVVFHSHASRSAEIDAVASGPAVRAGWERSGHPSRWPSAASRIDTRALRGARTPQHPCTAQPWRHGNHGPQPQ